jgi:DNA-binding beta-propeller fold protein YncE
MYLHVSSHIPEGFRGRQNGPMLGFCFSAVVTVVVALTSTAATAPGIKASNQAGSVHSARIIRALPLPVVPFRIATAGRYVWVGSRTAKSVLRIDAPSAKIIRPRTRLSEPPYMLAADRRAAWAAGDTGLWRIDGRTGRPGAEVSLVGFAIAIENGVLFAANFAQGTSYVYRFDTRSGIQRGLPTRVDVEVLGLAAGAGSVWAICHDSQTLVRLDAVSGRRTGRLRLAAPPHGVAYGDGAVWVASYHTNSILRVDPRTNRITKTIRVPFPPEWLAAGGGSVWSIHATGGERPSTDRRLLRIDSRNGRIVQVLRLPGVPTDVELDGASLWVTVRHPNRLLQIAT